MPPKVKVTKEEIIRAALDMVRENKELRREVEEASFEANKHISVARSVMSGEALDVALLMPKQELSLDVTSRNVMSVNIPVFDIKMRSANENDAFSYGFAFTSGDLDEATKNLSDVFKKMVRLAEIEKSCQMMSAEIEKTRRRVNALEHVLIPQYMDTIKYITMKLDENERSTTTRLMKVKDMMMKQQLEMQKRAEKAVNV